MNTLPVDSIPEPVLFLLKKCFRQVGPDRHLVKAGPGETVAGPDIALDQQ